MIDDIAKWLPQFIHDKWDLAVESLRAAGVTTPDGLRPVIANLSTKSQAAVSHRNAVHVRVYEETDLTSTPRSWGDTDRDVETAWAIDVKAEGSSARANAHGAHLVLDKLLQLHRKAPHADWNAFDSWRKKTVQDYHDFQQFVVTVRLARYGEVVATPVQDVV